MAHDPPPRKAAELMVACLEAEGVEYVFGVPGEENLDFLEALRCSTVRLVVTRHEQAAAFMAATYGRLTGRAGVVLSTLGPGATNLVTGIAFAQLGGMPLVAITGQKPIKNSKQGRFQIINLVRTLEPMTKLAAQVPSGDRIPSLVREAFRRAEEERPGAVHLELPEDIAREPTSARPLPRLVARRPAPDAKAVGHAADLIMAANHPLLLLAAGANRKRISQSLDGLVAKTGIPFFTTQMGKGVLDERHPGYLGAAALSQGDYLHCAIERADLIVCIGHDVTEKPPAIMGHRHSLPLIHVNFYPAEVDDVYFPNLELIGDISHSIEALTAAITPSPDWDFSYFERMRAETQHHIAIGSDADHCPMWPQRVVADLRHVLPSDGILALDNGMYKLWIARNYPAFEPNTVLLDNALATMGAGLPSAMAAKLVYPDRPVVAVCGDGGFMMNSQELETAQRLGLNLVILILRDDGFGMIQWKQQEMGLADFGLRFGNPDFVRYAEAYGLNGHRVASAAEFAPLLARCLASPGLHLIDVPVDYSVNQQVLGEELRRKTCLL